MVAVELQHLGEMLDAMGVAPSLAAQVKTIFFESRGSPDRLVQCNTPLPPPPSFVSTPPPSTLPLLVQATALGKEVEAAVWTQAVFTHPVTKQQVFAYEVDG